jgi:hypothetical protein
MSVYQSRYDADAAGFYDYTGQLVVRPGAGLASDLVIDHEVAHLYLGAFSWLGHIEDAAQRVRMLWATVFVSVVPVLDDLAAGLRPLCEQVHEVTAWYCSVLYARHFGPDAHPDARVRVPTAYRADVERVDRSVTAAFGGHMNRDAADTARTAIEHMAIRALSPPWVEEAVAGWGRGEALDVRDHAAGAKSPIRTFRESVEALAGSGASSVQRWADEIRPSTDRRDRYRRRAVETAFRSAAPNEEWPDLTDAVELTCVYLGFGDLVRSNTSQYARACVQRPEEQPESIPPGFRLQLDMLATKSARTVIIEDQQAHMLLPSERALRPTIAGGQFGVTVFDHRTRTLRDHGLDETSVAALCREPGTVAVAFGNSYDYHNGDLAAATAPILHHRPHAVIVVSSFVDLLEHLFFGGEDIARLRGTAPGLVGQTDLVFSSGPMLLDSDFGYFLVRPRQAQWPIVVIPILMFAVHRLVDAFDAYTGLNDVAASLTMLQQKELLGNRDMEECVFAALGTFERWLTVDPALTEPERLILMAQLLPPPDDPPSRLPR